MPAGEYMGPVHSAMMGQGQLGQKVQGDIHSASYQGDRQFTSGQPVVATGPIHSSSPRAFMDPSSPLLRSQKEMEKMEKKERKHHKHGKYPEIYPDVDPVMPYPQ